MAPSSQHGLHDYPASVWRCEGLFSDHYLQERLPTTSAWPAEAEADLAFDAARALLSKGLAGLRKGDEGVCEQRFVTPMLAVLGYGHGNRKRIPESAGAQYPDYLLYPGQAEADDAFYEGTREAHYRQAIGLLEAKRWGHNLSEDSSGRGKAPKGRSPHFQIRDYLSEVPRLNWGILTNGAEWRLYCKHERASAYFAFDLEAALTHDGTSEGETGARAHFRVFYALFRRAALERDAVGRCALDALRDGAQSFREDIERELREQVFDSVETLAAGLLDNPQNGLTHRDAEAVYTIALVLLYRILFVLNAEARGLLPTRPNNTSSRRYYYGYGLEWVRDALSDPERQGQYEDDQTFCLWMRLRGLFALISGQSGGRGLADKNEQLGIPRYNGGLFDPARHPELEACAIGDQFIGEVLLRLSSRLDPHGHRVSYDYRGLGERHLGSIYEGLLEHRLVLRDGCLRLVNDRGERKSQGAYYTPQAFVSHIVEGSLQPLLDRISDSLPAAGGKPSDDRSQQQDDRFAEAMLELSICDPAMGSAHFLVEAVAFLAERAASHPTTRPRPEMNADGSPRIKADGSGELLCTQDARLAYWKRRVVESCIYGVDQNPLAVELAKLSLWLKTVDRVPLNFLDHHLRVGNSLVGATLESARYYPVAADPKRRGSKGGKNGNGKNGNGKNGNGKNGNGKNGNGKNGNGGNGHSGELDLEHRDDLAAALSDAIAEIRAIETAPAETHEAAKAKEASWRRITDELLPPFRQKLDLWIAPWFGGKVDANSWPSIFEGHKHSEQLWAENERELRPLNPFHWELEFPDVFFNSDGTQKADPGFDAVIGNPPWERVKLAENEFFGGRSAAIALAPKAAERKRLIAKLPQTEPALWAEYQAALQRTERTLAFLHHSGHYPLMGKGDTNYYAVFAEKALGLIHSRGRIGLLVPSGIATDHTTKEYFQQIVQERRLAELLDFENRQKAFPDVDSRFKFSVLMLAGADDPRDSARCGFFLHDFEELAQPDRAVMLSAEDFKLFNPNTLTCPVFRSGRDAELTRRIYHAAPILIRRNEDEVAENHWGASFLRMFDMTNDSGLFRTESELVADGYWLSQENAYRKGPERYLPLYEGKMVQMYDHRAASITINPDNLHRPANERATTAAEYADPAFTPKPQYCVEASHVIAALGGDARPWLLGYKDVTAPTNARTVIASAIPSVGVGNTLCLVRTGTGLPAWCLLANLSAFALDFVARQKIGGQHLNFYLVEQFPVFPPSRYDELFGGAVLKEFIGRRVLELSYTAPDMKGLADDFGYAGPPFAWDEERRLHLRCQLDALYFHLYGLAREDAEHILSTFPISREKDQARYGSYRTRDLILGYWSAYAAGDMDAWVKG